jgi:hypothetical protein
MPELLEHRGALVGELVEPLPTAAGHGHQVGAQQHREVLAGRGPTHATDVGELGCRACGAVHQHVEHG